MWPMGLLLIDCLGFAEVSKQCRSSVFVFVFRTPCIQTLIRHQSESMVNSTRVNSAQSIIFGISPVVKQYHPLPRSITCKGVVSWFRGWYWVCLKVNPLSCLGPLSLRLDSMDSCIYDIEDNFTVGLKT